MKLFNIISTRIALTLLLSIFYTISCTTPHTAGKSGKTPPGKAKKIYGTKSAKPYAPGQRKKEAKKD